MFDVIGFGALNLDRLCYVKRIAVAGEHQPVRDVFECPGGSAANTVAWLADSDFKTGFLGTVGRDSEGLVVLEDFKNRGVDTSQVKTLKGRTGVVTGFVDSKGERTLYPYSGVNDQLELDKAMMDYAGNSRFLHMSSFVNERQFHWQKNMVRQASGRVKISLSPSDLYAKKGLNALRPLLEKTFVLFLNRGEIREITGVEYRKGSEILNDVGVEIVAVTLGSEGCYVRSRREEVKIGCARQTPVDTTGAGDAYASGFLTGLLKNKNLKQCGMLGNRLAGQCIKLHGARRI